MGAWDTILKYGGKAMKGMGKAANATGKVPVMRYCIPRRPFGEPGRRSKWPLPELPSAMWAGKN